MRKLLILAIVGLAAQLVDGSLGMAYGVTSTTLLVLAGIAPAFASASVHLAEVGTTLVSGLSHWKLGNVSWSAVGWLAVPGAVGAFCGAVVLSSVSAEAAKPWIALFLFLLGTYILIRFAFLGQSTPQIKKKLTPKFLVPLGALAGFLDAAGGGGWGPISTPTILASGRLDPRRTVGTVDTSEFLVAIAASAGFLVSLDRSQIALQLVLALLIGGMIAAPIAAWLVRTMHPRVLGSAVGGLILLTNARTLLTSLDASQSIAATAYGVIGVVWVSACVTAFVASRQDSGERRVEISREYEYSS